MRRRTKRISVDTRTGSTSDGGSLYDYSDEKLIDLIEGCWFSDIVELAKSILESRKVKIEKVLE